MSDAGGQMSGTARKPGVARSTSAAYIGSMRQTPSTDQRALRTRQSLLDAFVGLILGRRYETIRVTDLVAAAGVGRATFYEHFRSKDDILLSAMEPVLLALATAASGRAARSYVRSTISHLWERRSLGRTILNSATGPIVQRRLAAMILTHIARAAPADIAPSIRATGIAAAQLSMLRSWLIGEASCTAEEMTDRMIDCAKLIA